MKVYLRQCVHYICKHVYYSPNSPPNPPPIVSWCCNLLGMAMHIGQIVSAATGERLDVVYHISWTLPRHLPISRAGMKVLEL